MTRVRMNLIQLCYGAKMRPKLAQEGAEVSHDGAKMGPELAMMAPNWALQAQDAIFS